MNLDSFLPSIFLAILPFSVSALSDSRRHSDFLYHHLHQPSASSKKRGIRRTALVFCFFISAVLPLSLLLSSYSSLTLLPSCISVPSLSPPSPTVSSPDGWCITGVAADSKQASFFDKLFFSPYVSIPPSLLLLLLIPRFPSPTLILASSRREL